VGRGVQLGPLGKAATDWPIVPAPGDYDEEFGGMKIGRGNRSTRRKSAPVPLCPGSNLGCRGGKPATNRLSHGAAYTNKSNAGSYRIKQLLHMKLKSKFFFFIFLKEDGPLNKINLVYDITQVSLRPITSV
jgi:hypothetical protein